MRLTWHQGRPTELQGATSRLGLPWVHSLLAPFGNDSELPGDLILRKILPQHMDTLDNGWGFVRAQLVAESLTEKEGKRNALSWYPGITSVGIFVRVKFSQPHSPEPAECTGQPSW